MRALTGPVSTTLATMKRILNSCVALLLALASGCSGETHEISAHVSVPSTNLYSITQPTRITGDLSFRKQRGRQKPDIVLEYSTNGTTYLECPRYSSHLDQNPVNWPQLDVVEPTDIWLRVKLTESNSSTREVRITFAELDR